MLHRAPVQKILLRVTTRDGLFRIEIMNNSTVQQLKQLISEKVGVDPKGISVSKGERERPFLDNSTLQVLQLKHGDKLFASYGATSSSSNSLAPPEDFKNAQSTTKILMDEDAGSDSSEDDESHKALCNHGPNVKCPNCTKSQRYVEVHRRCPLHPPWGSCVQCQEWRQSLMPKMKRQEKRKCKKILLSAEAGQGFSGYAITYGAEYKRIGVVYGRETAEKTIIGEVIYEPPQNSTKEGASFLPDPKAEKVNMLTQAMGLKPVAWVFSCAQCRSEILTSQEAVIAGRFQLQYGHRFSTLVLAVPDPIAEKKKNESMAKSGASLENEKIREGMEAYQVSMQLTRLIRRGIIAEQQTDTMNIQTTEPVIIEMAETGKIPTEFCLVNVPITPTDSKLHISYPIENRPTQKLTTMHLLNHLQDAKKRKEPFSVTIADFHFLLALMDVMEAGLLCEIAQAVMKDNGNIGEGYEIMVKNACGME